MLLKFLKEYYESLSLAYENAGDYKNALEAYRKARKYEKSYVNDSTLNILADFKTEQATKIHEYEKRELVVEQRRMRTLVFSLVAGLFLFSLLVFYILRMLSVKKKANDEISMQKEIIMQQWLDVEDVNKKLLDSITYAKLFKAYGRSVCSFG